MVKQGSWVSITRTILTAQKRTASLPEDTSAVPFVMWVKGYLVEDAEIGQPAKVRTKTGRIEEGILEEVNPQYELNYGNLVPELLSIGDDARAILFGGEDNA